MARLTTTITSETGEQIVVTVVLENDGGEILHQAEMAFKDGDLDRAHEASHRLHLLHLIDGEGEGKDGDGG